MNKTPALTASPRALVQRRLAALCALLLAVSPCVLSAQALTPAFTYQGELRLASGPATANFDMQFRLYSALAGGSQIGATVSANNVAVSGGLFAVPLDFGPEQFAGERQWLEIAIRPAGAGSFETLSPRTELTAAPYAWGAAAALANSVTTTSIVDGTIGTADINPTQIQRRVGSSCAAGQYVRVINQDGTVNCGTDANAGGTVTNVATGTGLTGGPIIGSGTVAVAAGGIGTTQINTTQVQRRVSGSCATGQYVRSVNEDGTVVCEADAIGGSGTVTEVTAGAGLSGGTITASGTIGISPGGVGLAQINVAQVQRRVSGTCPVGSYLRGINGDGTVLCTDLPVESAVSFVDVFAVAGSSDPSMAIGSDRRPIISYHDRALDSLKVAKCQNTACTGTATITFVDGPGNAVGQFSAIAIGTDGLPVISYYDATARALKVARCANIECTGIATRTTVDDPANNVGQYTAIAVGDDQRPVIGYYDSTAGNLKVAKCANAACTGSATITTVDASANDVGRFTALAIDKTGIPVMSYHDRTANALKFAKCANAACTGTATITTVDDPANSVGQYTAIAIGSNGNPVISYYDDTANALKIAVCGSTDCSGSILINTIDDPVNDVGQHTSIAIGSNELPVISYFDADAGALKVAMCGNAVCFGAATITFVDNPGSAFVGAFTSIAIGADGMPVISYEDIDSNALKVVKCGTRSCR